MYEIYPLKIGQTVEEEPRTFYLGDCKKKLVLYQYMWLIKGDGKIILVDTGFIKKDCKNFNPDVEQKTEEEPLRQLNRLKIKPEEIDYLILTHCHWDHLSPVLTAFSNAKIFVQEKEILSIINPSNPWFAKFVFKEIVRKLISDYKSRLCFVNGEKEILKGIKVFLTGGHTPGHQSVMVETKIGKIILAGDVVLTYRNIEENIPVGFNCNLEECFNAMEKIKKEADVILPGHDPIVFKKYREGI